MAAPTPDFLPYGRQTIEDDDIAAVVAVLRGDWLTTGPMVAQFEAALASQVGAEHAVACASGTAGLHLAMAALGIGRGDRVIVPTLTFAATANAVRFVGADVVFADVAPDTGLMTATTAAEAIARSASDGGPPVRAIVPVQLNGQASDLSAIAAIARKHHMAVILDAAHAIGTAYVCDSTVHQVGDGHHADLSVFSFHPVKTIAMGEGGAVTTNDAAHAAALRRLRHHGMVRDADALQQADLAFDSGGRENPWYYEIDQLGWNYRVTDMQCALGLSQLGKLDRFVARRAALANRYDAALARFGPHVRPLTRVADCRPAWHLYVALIDFAALGIERGHVMRTLRDARIGTMVHYMPVHLHPYYRRLYGAAVLPGAHTYYDRALSLPLFPAMADSDVDRVVVALAAALNL